VYRFPIAIVLAILMANQAWAALGDTEISVQADTARLKASLRVVPATAYAVHELQLAEGTTVREFVASTGVVFAVSWQGPFKPDLRQLLGTYADTYDNAPRSAGSSRSHLAIDTADLVVRAGGHMRAFAGVAWIPKLVPAGVNPEVLQ
jgi:hypothetical protein